MKWEVVKPLEHGLYRILEPEMVVVHAMAEYIDVGTAPQHAWDFLQSNGLSAHILVTPSGVLLRCREDAQGAYHARGFNNKSLGIEFLVGGVYTYPSFLDAIQKPYLTPTQYQQGVAMVRHWNKDGKMQVVRHSDIDPQRKHDPGDGFPWDIFREDIF